MSLNIIKYKEKEFHIMNLEELLDRNNVKDVCYAGECYNNIDNIESKIDDVSREHINCVINDELMKRIVELENLLTFKEQLLKQYKSINKYFKDSRKCECLYCNKK